MKRILNIASVLFISVLFMLNCDSPVPVDHELLESSEELLLKVKRGENTEQLEHLLANIPASRLKWGLLTDRSKKSFWLNIYNGYFQLVAQQDTVAEDSIFTQKTVEIAGLMLSFDDIEHGILRKQSGYDDFESLVVDSVDYRIHFALNCGAKSCPPIAFYKYEKLDEQLEQATKNYLLTTTEMNEEEEIVRVTELMDWFAEDFGGEERIPAIIKKYTGRDISGYTVEYIPFDWTEQLANFK